MTAKEALRVLVGEKGPGIYRDPDTLEAQLNGLVSASKNDNVTPVDPSQSQPVSSTNPADKSSTASVSSAGGSLSNMMDMFNGMNPTPASAGSQAQPATADSSVAEQEGKADPNSVNQDTPDPTKDSDK